MKIYIICPVKELTEKWKKWLLGYTELLEKDGHKVHLPFRDTSQDDAIGFKICLQNKIAIEEADEIRIAWDGVSQGSLFDMGMAFAFKKSIKIIDQHFPEYTTEKSIQSMVQYWSQLSMYDELKKL